MSDDAPVLVRPRRIVVQWGTKSSGLLGYRDPPASARHALTMRFSAFLWFNLYMVVLCGAPLAALVGYALGGWLGIGAIVTGAIVGYMILAVVLNRVEIRVDGDRILSKLAPIPLWPSKSIPVAGITHVRATQSTHSRGWGESSNVSWYVVAMVGDDEKPITRHLRTRDEAVFVARTIEQQLGLTESDAFDGAEGEGSSDS